jgi:uncharacterized protein (DUF1810 family)
MTSTFDLERFVDAQNDQYPQVLRELAAGRKTSHWMWYVFPQIKGLGSSFTAQKYAISSLDEARAYLEHPVLGARLRECTERVLLVQGRSAHAIFGSPDDLKFRSCMTLFSRAAEDPAIFEQALAKYYGGEPDPRTLAQL